MSLDKFYYLDGEPVDKFKIGNAHKLVHVSYELTCTIYHYGTRKVAV